MGRETQRRAEIRAGEHAEAVARELLAFAATDEEPAVLMRAAELLFERARREREAGEARIVRLA